MEKFNVKVCECYTLEVYEANHLGMYQKRANFIKAQRTNLLNKFVRFKVWCEWTAKRTEILINSSPFQPLGAAQHALAERLCRCASRIEVLSTKELSFAYHSSWHEVASIIEKGAQLFPNVFRAKNGSPPVTCQTWKASFAFWRILNFSLFKFQPLSFIGRRNLMRCQNVLTPAFEAGGRRAIESRQVVRHVVRYALHTMNFILWNFSG